MERSLDLDHIADAIGRHEGLPSPEQLQSLMAELEVALFVGQGEISREVLRSGWYLHGVASAPPAADLYTPERQRRAFQVSAHIFDLALSASDWSRQSRLALAFASEVGYRRGELEPNALAVYRRVSDDIVEGEPIEVHIETLALEAGVALLGLDTRRLFRLFAGWRSRLRALARQIELDDLRGTLFGPSATVVNSAEDLLIYLAFGRGEQLERAQAALSDVLAGEAGPADLDVRWVAAHLLQLGNELGGGSVWSVLPPDVPSPVKQAFTLVDPPVLTLWRPQRELLAPDSGLSPLDPSIRRMVASVPTSAGKTLIGQLLILHHVAVAGTGVCFVAPWRSLGREVRRSLRRRMQVLEKELGTDEPDFGLGTAPGGPDPHGRSLVDLLRELADRLSTNEPPAVEVMTPERLFHLLRHDAESVLDRFGMFIFDEAQLLAEPGRGFTLESVLSFLHWRTEGDSHRIALLSATMGNVGEVMSWLDPAGRGTMQSSDWRGPRRLDAIFTTAIDWDAESRSPIRSEQNPLRLTYPLIGRVRLRPADGAGTRYLRLTEPVGEIAFKATADGRRLGRDTAHSTPNYRSAARIVAALGHGGSALVVTSTRPAARRMATALAELRDDEPGLRPLADSLRQRLGHAHPLVGLVEKGVGYHHAGLPAEVLEELEEAIRDDRLRFLAATTTLAEGVNLPVRTVVIAETRYEGQPPDARITGPRLINAMGRAGRAGRETEGWVVFIQTDREREGDFDVFRPGDDDLAVRSRLATSDALDALSGFEELQRSTHDAVFRAADREMADFISFVWFVLAAEEALGRSPSEVDLEALLDSTLAFRQLDDDLKARWTAAAASARAGYAATLQENRRRWARAGTSIPTAIALDELSDTVAYASGRREPDEMLAASSALQLLESLSVLDRLLELPEAPRWAPRKSEAGRIQPVDVKLADILNGWIGGEALQELADRLLGDVPDKTWRLEQLVEIVSSFFEHYLSWTLGALIELTNEKLEADGSLVRLCPQLPAYVRYGVENDSALALLVAGVRSRRLAHTVAAELGTEEGEPEDIRSWIAGMGIEAWRRRFGATPSELLDLLDFARERRRSLLRALLEEGEVTIELDGGSDAASREDSSEPAFIGPVVEDPEPRRLGLYGLDSDSLLATVPSGLHADVEAIRSTGLEIECAVDIGGHHPTATLSYRVGG